MHDVRCSSKTARCSPPEERPRVLRGHSVLIEDGLHHAGSPRAGRFGRFTGKRIDAAGKVVLPGLINAHTHFYSTFARGLTKTKPAQDFIGVLKNLWWRLDSALTTEDCYYSALIALLDSIRHGTTTLIDHHASPQAVAGSLDAIERAVRETGLRACLCYEVSDRDGARIAKEGLEENARFIRRCQRAGRRPREGALRPARLVHALGRARWRRPRPSATSLHTGFHIHVAEAQSDQDCGARHRGMRVVERLKQFGILGPRSHRGALHPRQPAGNGPAGGDGDRGRAQPAVEPEQRRRHRGRRRDGAGAASSSASARTP